MSLENQINADIKQAMLAKKKEELEALRAIKSAVLLLKTSPEVNANNGEISDAMELSLLQKLVKQRREAAVIYVQQGRQDLADVEMGQAEVISRYLPKQMDRGEVEALLREIIAEVGATSPKDMGKVMGTATKRLAGKADNKMVSEIVKALLMQ